MKIRDHFIKRRVRYATLGVVATLFPLLSIPISSMRPFLDELPESSLCEAEFHQGQSYMGPDVSLSITIFSDHSDFRIRCPQTMKENETKEFSLEFDRYTIVREFQPLESFYQSIPTDTIRLESFCQSIPTDTIRYKGEITEEKTVELHSSGFKISPSTKIKKASMTELPTLFLWTIKPESEGDHTIILDISELIRLATKDSILENNLMVNGQKNELDYYGSIRFPIRVFTFWGISRKAYGLTKNIILFCGFILMYPVLHEWLKRRLKLGINQ